jgi:hypothetical protein
VPVVEEFGTVDADAHADAKRLDEIAVGLIEKHGVGLNDLDDLTSLGRESIDPLECRSVEVHRYGQGLAGVPKNAQLPAEKAALHQLGEEGFDQIEIESLLEVAMWQIAVAAGDVLQNGVGWIMSRVSGLPPSAGN